MRRLNSPIPASGSMPRSNRFQSIPPVLRVDPGSPILIQSGAGPSVASERLAEAERSLDNLRLRFTEAHPDVIAARRLVELLQAAATERTPASVDGGHAGPLSRTISNPSYEQLRLRIADMEVNAASLTHKVADGKSEVDRLEKLAKEAPGVEAKYERLDRDYNIIKKNHDELVARLESAKLASAADTKADSTVRVIESPRIAQVPIAPKRKLLISVVLVAAIAAGGGVVFLLQQIDHSFDSVQALREIGLPVLGGISLAVSAGDRWSKKGALGFAAVTVLLIVVYGGLMFAASKMGATI